MDRLTAMTRPAAEPAPVTAAAWRALAGLPARTPWSPADEAEWQRSCDTADARATELAGASRSAAA